MPTADKLTSVYDGNLWPEAYELTAWLYAEQFTPTPQLVFAAELAARILSEPDYPDWYARKPRTCVLPSKETMARSTQ
jgi:hypothetical protein